MDSELSPLSNSLCITHWENYRSQTLPTDSTDEPINRVQGTRAVEDNESCLGRLGRGHFSSRLNLARPRVGNKPASLQAKRTVAERPFCPVGNHDYRRTRTNCENAIDHVALATYVDRTGRFVENQETRLRRTARASAMR
jgi:hypothetical protein